MDDIYGYLRYTANLISQSHFHNKMILKGGSVLISKLIECGREDLYRLTSDLDIHCDKKEVWIEFCNDIEDILNKNDRGYVYRITKRRSEIKGLNDSDSLTFSLEDHGKIVKFQMDMNIKSNTIITVDYSPLLQMNTYDAYTMLSDKIVVVSSNKIYRRIKDLYDILVLASIFDFKYSELVKHINIKHPNVKLKNMIVPDNISNIEHAYNVFSGIRNKPDIRYLLNYCLIFLEPIYLGYNQGELIWNTQQVKWLKP